MAGLICEHPREQHDGLWFPTVHRSGGHAVYTRDVQTMNAVPAATFTTP